MIDKMPLDSVQRSVVDATPGTVYRRRTEGRQPLLSATDGCEALTGYDPDALDGDGRGWLDVVHPDDREQLREAVDAATADDPAETTYRLRTADGTIRWVRDRFTAPRDDVVGGFVLDVTEERERVADLEGDAELLDAVFENVPVHLFVKDDEARHVRVSDYLEDSDRFLGKTDLEIEGVSEEHARRAYEDDLRVLEEGEPILDKEEHLPDLDVWNITSKVPWRDERGEVVGLVGVSRRITERKRAQQELRKKTERLEEFADVVAHDIRNPLTVARGQVDLAMAADDPDEHVAEAADAIDRAGGIVEDVLALSRFGAEEVEPRRVSLPSVAREAWRSVDTGDATLEVPDGGVTIRADRTQLRRLLENLFSNAVEHGGDDVTVAVEALESGERSEGSRSSEDERSESSGGEGSEASRASTELSSVGGFAVADDGPGVPPDERDLVFEAGYTTAADGTGFGLAIVEEIAEAHGWTARLDESGSGGARFEFADATVEE